MNTYKRQRLPPDIISYAVPKAPRGAGSLALLCFKLSHLHIEDLLAQRCVTFFREAIRLWYIKFGAIYSGRLKRKHRGFGDNFCIDEVFVKIKGKPYYL